MGAKFMVVYPNIKHCYQNNWTVKREGCNTPFYSILDYFGRECFWLMGASWLLLLLILFLVNKWVDRRKGSVKLREEEVEGEKEM